jgi:hypothetical protein
VEGLDVGGRGLQGFKDSGVKALIGRLDLGGGHFKFCGSQIRLVLAVPAQAFGVPVPAQRGQNGPHVLDDLVDVLPGAVQQVVEPRGRQPFQQFHLHNRHPGTLPSGEIYCNLAIIYDCSRKHKAY